MYLWLFKNSHNLKLCYNWTVPKKLSRPHTLMWPLSESKGYLLLGQSRFLRAAFASPHRTGIRHEEDSARTASISWRMPDLPRAHASPATAQWRYLVSLDGCHSLTPRNRPAWDHCNFLRRITHYCRRALSLRSRAVQSSGRWIWCNSHRHSLTFTHYFQAVTRQAVAGIKQKIHDLYPKGIM